MSSPPVPWLRSLLAAGVAAYGPFAAMTLYTQLFVACQHCKQATLWLLPSGPGVLGTTWLNQISGIPRLPDAACIGVAMIMSGLFVSFMASFGRLGRAWLAGAVLFSFVCSSVQAIALLMVIQM